MICLDEVAIGSLLKSLADQKVQEPKITFETSGLALTFRTPELNEKIVKDINKMGWMTQKIAPSDGVMSCKYGLEYFALRDTGNSKKKLQFEESAQEILSRAKPKKHEKVNSKKGGGWTQRPRGSGIPIKMCPTCKQPGRIVAYGSQISVLHGKKEGGNGEKHNISTYLKDHGFDAKDVSKKIDKLQRGLIVIDWAAKIPAYAAAGQGTVSIQAPNGKQISPDDAAWYIEQVRESMK